MINKTISHYKILEKIGEGGMGVVYKAEDTKLKRIVALKFLPPELTRDEDAKKRFLHEARAAATLDHPNICTVHEIGETEDGQMFIAMGYYEGHTLKDKITNSPLPITDSINIAIQIAEGLQEAHTKGIVHRDIKSANIIITDKGVAKILDFGLAKLKGQTKLTKEGTTLGTVSYMSPEQASGEESDHRSDIWSLGVLLYEMVTGKVPFKGEYEQAIMYAIMNEEPEPVTGLRTGVPLELERIISKSLEKEFVERYQHVDDIMLDLKKVKKDSQPGINPAKRKTKPETGIKIPQKLIMLGSFVLIIIIAAIVAGILFQKNKTRIKPVRKMLVVLPFENLGDPEDEYFTAGMHEEITTRLAMIRNLGVISRSSAKMYTNTEKTIKEIGRELGVHYILKGTVRWARLSSGPGKVRISPHLINAIDDTHIWADTYERVLDDIFKVQSDIARKVAGELNITLEDAEYQAVEISHTDNMDAYHAFLKAEYLISQPHFTQNMWPEVINNYKRAVDLDPEFALAWAQLARSHARLVYFNLDLSPERRQKAIRAAERAMELKPESPKVHLALSYYHLWISRDIQMALKELEVAKKKLPSSTRIMNAQANIFEVQGRFQDMIEILNRVHELNPLSVSILINKAMAYWFSRNYPKAIEASDQAIALSPDEAWAHLHKVLNFWSWKGAVPEARQAIEHVQPSHSWVHYVWYWQNVGEGNFQQAFDRLKASNIEWINIKILKIPLSQAYAYLYEFMGQPEKARQYYLKAKATLEVEINNTPDDPRLHSSLGITLASLSEKEEAIREGKRAIEILPYTKDAVYSTPLIHDLALIYIILGEYELALDQIEYLLLKIPCVFSPGWMKLDPRWKKLMDLPRYKKILQEYREKYKY